MAKKNPRQELAEILFVTVGKSQKEIAEEVGVSQVTVSGWAKAGKWKEKRQLDNVGIDSLIKRYIEQSNLIIDDAEKENRPMKPAEVDSVNKFSKSIEQLKGKITPSLIMAVLMRLNSYLQPLNPAFTKQLAQYEKEFILSIINNAA